MAKYCVEVRMKNPGPVQYLISATDCDDFGQALTIADQISESVTDDHFVQIKDKDGDIVASLGPVGRA